MKKKSVSLLKWFCTCVSQSQTWKEYKVASQDIGTFWDLIVVFGM